MVDTKKPDDEYHWKNCSEALKSIILSEYIDIDERNISIYNTADEVLFNKDVIEQYANFVLPFL